MTLSKADFFKTETNNIYSKLSSIEKIIQNNQNFDSSEQKKIVEEITEFFDSEINESKKIFNIEKYDDLNNKIKEAVKQSGILSLFIVWENSINKAASSMVTNIYKAVPSDIEPKERLMAVANSLSKNVLEQQYDKASKEERLQAAFLEMNDLFEHFYESETDSLETKIDVELENGNETELRQCADELNTWKLIRKSGKNETPGQVFRDKSKGFKWFSFAKSDDAIKEYEEKVNELSDQIETNCTYIYININGECETAQKKAKHLKIVPGVILNKELLLNFGKIDQIRQRDDLIIFGPLKYDEKKDQFIVFSLEQCSSVKLSMTGEESLFILNRKYYFQVRQKIANNLYKQGLDLYRGS